jgi:hypothetical protein
MRTMILFAAAVVLANAPVFAQPTQAPRPDARAAAEPSRTPIDVGPNTPAANGAYQGGGVVLQGAPGAPPPPVRPTPAGQTPRGAVQP